MKIQIAESDLPNRCAAVSRFLRPLRPRKPVSALFSSSSVERTATIKATDGVGLASRRDRYFKTSNDGLYGQYFEIWVSLGKRLLGLNRAYFMLFQACPATHELTELLSIHCDPEDTLLYKCGPHLHVSCAIDPIPKCHFPLNHGELNQILSSLDYLSGAFNTNLQIVADEVLSRF